MLKNADQTKVPSQATATTGKFEKVFPDKKKQLYLGDTKTPAASDADLPTTKNAPELKNADTDLSEANIKKLEKDLDPQKTDLDKADPPKDPQVANGEKPPKSQILEDDPNLKDKDLDNFKKYEDDVDASTKKK